jgi:hypothetical protein
MALIDVAVTHCKPVLCGEAYRPTSKQRPYDWVVVRIIVTNQIGKRHLPDVSDAQPLAQVRIAVSVHVDSLWT